ILFYVVYGDNPRDQFSAKEFKFQSVNNNGHALFSSKRYASELFLYDTIKRWYPNEPLMVFKDSVYKYTDQGLIALFYDYRNGWVDPYETPPLFPDRILPDYFYFHIYQENGRVYASKDNMKKQFGSGKGILLEPNAESTIISEIKVSHKNNEVIF